MKGFYNDKGAEICGAKNRRGEHCGVTVLMPNGRCRIHGGKSLAGPAHPNYRHGRRWQAMPLDLVNRFERALGDPDLLSMSPEVAALDARADQLMGRLSTGESGKAWARVRRAWVDYQEARAVRDAELEDDARTRLEDAITRGAADEETWGELTSIWRDRRRFVREERERMIDAQVYTDVGRLTQVFAAIAEALVQHVPDRDARQAVVLVMQKTLGRKAPAALGVSGTAG
jgi:hypothetical protein